MNNLIQMLRSSNNPQMLLMNILRQSNNPLIANVASMMNSGQQNGIEQIARNICREKGINADALYNQILQIK